MCSGALSDAHLSPYPLFHILHTSAMQLRALQLALASRMLLRLPCAAIAD